MTRVNEASGSGRTSTTVDIYTDGACSGNPGPGGWAAILLYGDERKDVQGAAPSTTNQRMELQAAIGGLEALRRPVRVRLHSDSSYLVNAFNQGWIERWQRNGWQTAAKKPVSNKDLWEQLVALSKTHDIEWIKVPGHADDEWNNKADALARAAVQTLEE